MTDACKINNRPRATAAEATLLSDGVHPLLARLYASRGVSSFSEIDTRLSNLLHFNKLKNAVEMGVRLADAIAKQEKIVVVADYDVDGATACTVALRGLFMLGHKNMDFIVPNRFLHGYGLTPEIVDLTQPMQPRIILTVDNGIASIAGVERAKEVGIEVLVTDHHLQGDALPDALIVNPNQESGTTEKDLKCLAGVGVMFYVLLATRAELMARGAFSTIRPNLSELLDIVALGTVADVVPLCTNNRILVEQGILRIRAGKACAGIRALLRRAAKPPELVKASDFGFVLGPRINAAGRLTDMTIGIHCLLSAVDKQAEDLAATLDAINEERKNIQADMLQSAEELIKDVHVEDGHTVTLFDESWHQGVIGLLSSKIKDAHNRPVICFAKNDSDETEIKGSGRSIQAVHLRDALDIVSKKNPNLILKFGGHAMAAGLSIRRCDLELFTKEFEVAVASTVTKDDMSMTLLTDDDLQESDISVETATLLESAIWGQGFPAPAFFGEFEVTDQKILKEKHLKLQLKKGKTLYSSIIFNQTEKLQPRINAVYTPALNRYNGKTTVEIKLNMTVNQ